MNVVSDCAFEILDRVLKEYAPEISDIWALRYDKSENHQIKTGRLHENQILGIMLSLHLLDQNKVTTNEVEETYKKFYHDIAKSTISTYLNMLEKEAVLLKERDGRIVYYFLYEYPPLNITPFWFVRTFCVLPSYIERAEWFAELYLKAEIILKKLKFKGDFDKILENFKYLIGLTTLLVLKNRFDKCLLCQFSFKDENLDIKNRMDISIKDRMDVLSKRLSLFLNNNYGELPNFGGIHIKRNNITIETEVIDKFLEFSEKYNKDLEFQIMVSKRRQDLKIRK